MKPQAQPRHEGFSLVGMLIALAILGVMLAAAVPSVIRSAQASNAEAAAQSLNAISAGEFLYSSKYGAFVSPDKLVGNLANTASQPCLNPIGLLMGQQSTAPRGFAMSFVPGATLGTFTCPGLVGFSSFQINLDPADKLEATRHFFLSSVDQKIHFNDSQPATISDPIYALSSALVGGSGGGNGNSPSNGSGYIGTWSQGQNYAIGAYVLLSPPCVGAFPTGGCSSGGVGMFVNVTGNNNGLSGNNIAFPGFPAGDSADWQAVGSPVTFNLLGNPNPNATVNISVSGGGSFWTSANAPSGTAGNYTSFQVGLKTPSPTDIWIIICDVTKGCAQYSGTTGPQIFCGIPTGGTSCIFKIGTSTPGGGNYNSGNSFPNGYATNNPFTISNGDNLLIGASNIGGGTGSLQISWQLSP